MIDINNYFDNIYLLNLEKHKKKKLNIINHLDSYKINFELWEATDGYAIENIKDYNKYNKKPLGNLHFSEYNELEKYRASKFISSPGAWGYNLSMKSIIEDAKSNNYRRILILEDDVILDNEFKIKFDNFIKNINDDWKTIQLGGSQYGWENIENFESTSKNNFYYSSPISTCGSFALGLHKEVFNDILYNISFMESPFDLIVLGEVYKKYKGRCYTCFPNIVMPDVTESYIRGERNQEEHAKNMKWEIQNFKFPLKEPTFELYNDDENFKRNLIDSHLFSELNINLFKTEEFQRDKNNSFKIANNQIKDVKNLENLLVNTISSNIKIQQKNYGITNLEADIDVISKCKIITSAFDYKKDLRSQILKNKKKLLSKKIKEFNTLLKNNNIKKPLLSVVIPVFKVEKYIKECLISVLNATNKYKLKEYVEVVLIDDKDPNKSLKKVSQLIKDNINLISVHYHKQNLGLGGARNTGIENSQGEYILFLDSDDWIHESSIFKLFDKIISCNYPDIITTGFSAIKNGSVIWSYVPECQHFNNRRNVLNSISEGKITPAAWNKVLKKEILKDLRFSIHTYYEDLEFSPLLYSNASSFEIISESLVLYRQDGESITRKTTERKHIDDLNYVILSLIKKLKYDTAVNNFFFNRWGYLLSRWQLNNELKEIAINCILDSIKKLKIKEVKFNIIKPFLSQIEKLSINNSHEIIDKVDEIRELTIKFAPKVSVIITTYKRPKNLLNAVNSVLHQSYKNIEMIIVDDNFPDSNERQETALNISPLLVKHKNIKYIQHESNKKGAAARNTGLFNSNGKYISFLDDDDVYLNEKVEKSVLSIENYNNKYGAVYCGFKGWNSKGNDLSRYKEGDLTEDILTLTYTNHYLTTPTAFYKKDALLKINGFDESFIRHQDLEINLRFFEHFHVGVVKEILVQLNPEPTNVDNKLYNKDALDLKLKFFRKFKYLIDNFSLKTQEIIYEKHWNEVLRYSKDEKWLFDYLKTRNDIAPISFIINYLNKQSPNNSKYLLEEENNYNLSKIEKLESEIVQLEGIIKSKNDELDIIKSNLNWYKDENEKIINWYKNEIEKINKWHEAHYKKLPLPIIKIAKYLNKKTNA